MIYQGKRRYLVKEAMIHCSATRADWMEGKTPEEQWAEIRRWHVARGWRREGYHRGIARDGTLLMGRSLYEIGAGCRGHNRGYVHICLLGGHGSSADDKFEDHFTKAQRETLRAYLADLNKLTPLIRVTGHNEYAPKACPGFHVRKRDWLS